MRLFPGETKLLPHQLSMALTAILPLFFTPVVSPERSTFKTVTVEPSVALAPTSTPMVLPVTAAPPEIVALPPLCTWIPMLEPVTVLSVTTSVCPGAEQSAAARRLVAADRADYQVTVP